MKILCNVSMFDLHQQVLLVNDDNDMRPVAISTLENLGGDIAAACSKYSINNVTLTGNKNFAEALVEDICTTGATLYGMNNINIEVI